MTPEQIKLIVDEVERRWRARTPATNVGDVCPESRVTRSEVVAFANRNGINVPIRDDDYDAAMFRLFDRLRLEFPSERWEPRRKWTSATKARRKELGID